MMKCYTCRQDKEVFYVKGKRQTKVCQECFDTHYKSLTLSPEKRKEKTKARNERHRLTKVNRNQAYLREYLKATKCQMCPEDDWRVLDLDHLPEFGKKKAVSRLVSDGMALEMIQEEIAKCQVLCVKCHRLTTMTRGNHWRIRE